ncbi:hypothetical protein L6164_005486 [Bauhinia variegata]|uniref:Uncharacterized protein n=1 Tax=Bauhinia variegata TaxID=167791 RepID=A0ACB9PQP9_BAUVA|nr:hypothetical protein L6164_005486 [Bauhinia variegata]
MKREREIDNLTLANCLMLLSRQGEKFEASYSNSSSSHRVFECKTCNRQFPSFQALGGHRASHKKLRLMAGADGSEHDSHESLAPAKPKTHECAICGLEFAIGQALGGHMRRHRAAAMNEIMQSSASNFTMSSGSGSSFDSSSATKKKDNTKRVLFMDLNLTPLENDLQILRIRRLATPLVDCFY